MKKAVLIIVCLCIVITLSSCSNAKNTGAYLFVHFVNAAINPENAEQIYFSVSKDGVKWDTLNEKKPVLTSKLGDKGVRDPFIVRSPKNGMYYIIATDLSIYYRKDWSKVQKSGSQSIMVWESKDLVNWSKQRMAKVGPDTAGHRKQYMIKKQMIFLYIGHQGKIMELINSRFTIQKQRTLKPSQNQKFTLKETMM